MAIYVEAVQTDALPTGRYNAIVDRLQLDENSQYGTQIRWVFRITSGKYKDRELYAWSAYREKAGDKTKLLRWYHAIMGTKPSGKFDLQAVQGKPCRIVVTEETREDGTIYNKVSNVLPANDDDVAEPDPFA